MAAAGFGDGGGALGGFGSLIGGTINNFASSFDKGICRKPPPQNLELWLAHGGGRQASSQAEEIAFLRRELQEAHTDSVATAVEHAKERAFLQAQLAEVREENELQCASFNAARREQHKELTEVRERFEEREAETVRLNEEVCKWQHVAREKRKRMMKRETNPVKRRLERALSLNIAREMCIAKEGRVLEMVLKKTGGIEVCLVALCDGDRMLRWGQMPGPLSCTSSGVDVRLVARILYGHETLQAPRFNVLPHLSFSLVTPERSFDFICPDEDAAKCFVLALSRLCTNAVGRIMTPGEFASRKGWCKLREYCRFCKLSVQQAFLNAIRGRELQSELEGVLGDQPEPPRRGASAGGTPPAGMDLRNGSGEAVKQLDCFRQNGCDSESFDAPDAPRRLAGNAIQTNYVGSGRRKNWPRPGETWVFTCSVNDVVVYKDKECTEWANRLKCRNSSVSERQTVTILAAQSGQRSAEIRGTEKIKFVRGWIRLTDDSGAWLLEPAITASK